MAYANAWLNQQQNRWTPDRDRFTVETPPDPAHGDFSVPPEAVVMQGAPPAEAGGDIVSDVNWENAKHLPTSHLIDRTPVDGQGTVQQRGHGYGGTSRPYAKNVPRTGDFNRTPGYGRGFLGFFRGRDDGAAKDQTSQPPKYQFFNEQWFGVITSGFAAPPITSGPGDRVLRRGLNAYPENDGDGGRTRDGGVNVGSSWTVNMPSWKRGDYLRTNVNRDFTPPNRTHDNARFNRPDVVTIIGDAPPPTESDKYASPFTSLQKFLPKRRRIRGIRRVPGPFDEQSIVDTQATFEIPSADGMIVQ